MTARDDAVRNGAGRGDDDAPIVAVVPAAGQGSRLGAALPKQYLELDGACLLQRAIDALLGVPRVRAVIVATAPDDARFARLAAARDPRVSNVAGSALRAGSVLAGTVAARARWGDDAWVLVHDAARPLVARADIERLLDTVLAQVGAGDIAGGILAVRVVDTLKRGVEAASGSAAVPSVRIAATVPRDGLWQAQTPQLFRAGALADALAAALADDAAGDKDGGAGGGAGDGVTDHARAPITDEASAMERTGAGCLLVEARFPNPKVTRADDLDLAAALLRARCNEEESR